MKIFLMTDLEGVSGVRDFDAWCELDGRYYDKACRLLTLEVNAAVDGFFAGGARTVQVVDGHGVGAVDVEMLDPRADYARGWTPGAWPFGLDDSFDGIAWIGQHAKASTPFAHLPHTQSLHYIDLSVNGVSIGEFGQMLFCAAEIGVPAFFACGDEAFAQEAEELVPGIVTCAVKRGVVPGTGQECTVEEYRRRNTGAVHIAPPRARAMIRQASEAAMRLLKKTPPPSPTLDAPLERVAIMRPNEYGAPRTIAHETHAASFIELMRLPMNLHPLAKQSQ